MVWEQFSEGDRARVGRKAVLLLGLLNVFVVVLIVSYAFAAWNDAKEAVGVDDKLTVSFSGEGKVAAKPDVAKINATVFSRSGSLATATTDSNTKSNAVTAFLKEQGIAEKDVKTTGYYIQPQYQYPQPCYPGAVCPAVDQAPRISGYEIRSTYEITVRDIDKANSLLDGLVKAGANEVSGVVFTFDDPNAFAAEAREKAIADAKGKAEALAKQLGKKLGDIVEFSESGSGLPPIYYSRDAALEQGGRGGASPMPSVQPGENEVTAVVSLTYELK
jgi:uncharacterized protein YggE